MTTIDLTESNLTRSPIRISHNDRNHYLLEIQLSPSLPRNQSSSVDSDLVFTWVLLLSILHNCLKHILFNTSSSNHSSVKTIYMKRSEQKHSTSNNSSVYSNVLQRCIWSEVWVASCNVLLHLLVEQVPSTNSLLHLRSTKMYLIGSRRTSCNFLLLWASYEQHLLASFVSIKMYKMIVKWHLIEIFFISFSLL